jgi:tetratricopeptide (TPR) repeat protein
MSVTNYAKAFVSHSSDDKDLVERVTKQVTAARWEIDSHTFDEGRSSAEEIFRAISRSDLFVLFASAKALNSQWVASELQIAQSHLYSGKLGGVLVFIIDDSPVTTLPDWIRLYVFARTDNETRIANRIRSKLIQLDSLRENPQKPFVSRIRLRDEIEKRLADLARMTNAIYVSGADGIGRRALISNSLATLFPGSDVSGVDIAVADGEGILEVYRKLFLAWNKPRLAEANTLFEDTSTLPKDELIARTVELITQIGSTKTFAWFQCDFATLTEDGYFEPQFRELLSTLSTRRPTLVIRARRFPRFAEQSKLKNVAFFKVESLSDDESRRLWSYALEYHNFKGVDAPLIALLQEHISGHPSMIWTAAEYVATLGKAAIEANPKELIDTLRALSLSLIDGLPLTPLAERLLSLFDEFRIFAPNDLLAICGESDPDQALSEAVGLLVSFGLLESEGDHLKLASFFHQARFRKQFSVEAEAFLSEARKRLLEITQNYTAEDNISFATIDAAIITAVKEGRRLPLSLDERAIVGSHYLRVARSYYDREKYPEALKFCHAALAKGETLTESATAECLRLLAMSAVRVDDREALAEAIERLNRIASSQARRHVHFVQGFHARWNGDFESAETQFRQVLALSPKDVHALRELAQVLLIREDFRQAEKFAREALGRAPNSPYVIDMLLQCLIERQKATPTVLREDSEIAGLFARLELADRRENTSFFPVRQAHFHAALHNDAEALRWADEAVRSNRRQIYVYATRAQIRLAIKNDPRMLHSTDEDIRQVEKLMGERKGSKRYVGLLAKLHIRFELAKGDVKSALRHYEAAAHRMGPLKAKLASEIADRIVHDRLKDPELVAWANTILARK